MTDNTEFDVGHDFMITKREPRDIGGIWISGRLNGHRFQALVFQGHADNAEWELGESRISKLWIQRLADKREVYNWDRGLDVAPQTDEAQAIVGFLECGLADHIFGACGDDGVL